MTMKHTMDDYTGFADPRPLEDRIGDIRHQHMKLDGEHNRPDFGVWAEVADVDSETVHVVVSIGPLFGEQRRFVEFTPTEARKMARLLTDAADAIDAAVRS